MRNCMVLLALGWAIFGAAAEVVRNADFSAPPGREEKSNWVCRFPAEIGRDAERHLTITPQEGAGGYFLQLVPAGPGPVTVSGRVRGELLTPGTEHNFSFLVFFRDENGKWLGHREISRFLYENRKWPQATRRNADWIEFKGDAVAPEGTAEIGLRFDLSGPVRATFARLNAEVTPRPETPDLLTNGDFSAVGADGIPTGWQLHTPEAAAGKVTVATADHVVRCRVPDDLTDSQCWLVQVVPGLPQERYTLRFAARVRARVPAAEYGCELGVFFQDAQGKWLSYQKLKTFAYRSEKWKSANQEPAPDWVSGEVQFVAPARTARIGIRLNFSGAGIEAEWRDLKLEQPQRSVAQLLERWTPPATFPTAGQGVANGGITLTPDWSNQGAATVRSATRLALSLNGLWGYLPAEVGDGPWAYLKVPGEVRGGSATVLYGNAGKYDHQSFRPRFLARTVELPEVPADHRFFLWVEGTQDLALRAFWNGRPLGVIDSDWGGELEIPREVLSSGEPQRLLLLALPRKSSGELAHRYAAGKARPYEQPEVWSSGRLFDVALLGRGATPIFDSVRITPSWRQRLLRCTFPASGVPENLRYQLRITDAAGATLHEGAGLRPERRGDRLELTLPWPQPVVWTPETPNLLKLQLTATDATGRIVDQSLPLTFGFREVWREGKKLYLNGQELRLRPRMGMIYNPLNDEAFLRRSYQFCKEMGFNTLLRLSAMQSLEGAFTGMAPIRLADELGLFYIAYTPYALVSSGQFLDRAATEVTPELERFIDDRLISRFYNHPSVIAYSGFGTSVPLGDNVTYANQPDRWGIAPIDSDARIRELQQQRVITDAFVAGRMSASLRFVEMIRKLDPSRPFLSHYDSGAGDGWGIFDYFNWTPMQEWEEWVANYAARGVKPIGSWEHGNPYPMSFVNHAIPDGDGEPWVTEYAAIWLGPGAYRLETPAYRELVRKLYDPRRQAYGASAHHGTSYVNHQPAAQAVWAHFNRRLFRSWRLSGVNLGIEPFGPADNYVELEVLQRGRNARITDPALNLKTPGFKGDYHRVPGQWLNEGMFPPPELPAGLTPYGRVLYANNRDFLGFLAGGPENPLAKTHIFAPGETVTKQLALIYDGFLPLAGRIRGKIWLGDRVLETIDRAFSFTGSGTRLLPLTFRLPADAGGSLEQPESGRIELRFTAADGGELGRDSFTFSVLKPQPPERDGVVLYDPENTAGAVREFAGKVVTTPDFAGAKLVIFAPGALADAALQAVPPGAPLLVLALSAERLEELGFRAYPARLREFWPDPGFPVAAELLRDWRGGRPLRPGESFEAPRKGYNNVSSTTGMVAETVIETPDSGNFTPLLHGGFDLAHTALLETRLDGHRVLFCQLTLPENAAEDPAARALLNALVRRLQQEPPRRLSAPAVLGDPELLAQLGAPGVSPGLPDSGAVLVTAEAAPESLRALVEAGGTALVLPQPDSFYQAFGVAVRRAPGNLFQAEVPGLNAGNFHYRQDLELVWFGDTALRELPLGKGKLILIGFDPRKLDLEAEPYLKLSAQRQLRTLAQLLTQAGMALPAPERALRSRLRKAPVRIELSGRWTSEKIRDTVPGDRSFVAPEFDDHAWEPFVTAKNLTHRIDAQIRLHFRLTAAEAAAGELLLDAGTFDDFDETYLNGVRLGGISPENADPEQAWSLRRRYPVPAGVLREGDNVLAIRTWNRNGPEKGWQAQVRGPFVLQDRIAPASLYVLPYRHCDDPYLLHQW